MCLQITYLVYMHKKKAWRQLHKNAASNAKQVLEIAAHNAAAIRPFTAHHENYPS